MVIMKVVLLPHLLRPRQRRFKEKKIQGLQAYSVERLSKSLCSGPAGSKPLGHFMDRSMMALRDYGHGHDAKYSWCYLYHAARRGSTPHWDPPPEGANGRPGAGEVQWAEEVRVWLAATNGFSLGWR